MRYTEIQNVITFIIIKKLSKKRNIGNTYVYLFEKIAKLKDWECSFLIGNAFYMKYSNIYFNMAIFEK